MRKNILKLLLKLFLTGIALYLVIRNVDMEITWRVIKSANGGYLLLALSFFVLSKIFSSFRLNCFFNNVGLKIPTAQNLKLYGIGMFYNLFLPGGIGGDGYKVYLLNKIYRTPVRHLISAVLLDRVNGLGVLVFILFALLPVVKIDGPHMNSNLWGITGVLAAPVVYYWGVRLFFSQFMASLSTTVLLSFLVQLMQLVCAYALLLALGIGTHEVEYLFVFLLSSIVAVLPLTIGGVGARELVFIFSHDYMGIEKNSAVAFSLLFFAITAATSLVGIFLKFDPKNKASY